MTVQECLDAYGDKYGKSRYYNQWNVTSRDANHAPFVMLPETYSRTISFQDEDGQQYQVTYNETMSKEQLDEDILQQIPHVHQDITCKELWKNNRRYHSEEMRPLWNSKKFVDQRCYASFINNDICEVCGNEYGPANTFCGNCSSGSHRECQNIISNKKIAYYTCKYCDSESENNNNKSIYNYLYIFYIFLI